MMDPNISVKTTTINEPINENTDPNWLNVTDRSINGMMMLPNGLFEERVKVDRKKFEQMINEEDVKLGSAEVFFKKIMFETKTEISWPPKLKTGTKSKKDPHIRITGTSNSIQKAKEKILDCLDGRRNRVTLKMDVAFTDHSHIIGKGGRSIQKVMDDTGCHIHFPDSNRTNAVEKSNQVSIAGTSLGAEQARCRIRELLPLTFIFDLPLNPTIQTFAMDPSSPALQSIQQTYGITISIRCSNKQTMNLNGNRNGRAYLTVSVRGTRAHILGLKQGLLVTMEYFTGSTMNIGSIPLTLYIDIAAQHHAYVMGRSSINVRTIMQQTGALISFPDLMVNENGANHSNMRKSTISIKGSSFDSVYYAWQELLGYLPLILIFDLREGQELDAAQITQMMDQLKVSILIKPKQKQNLKSVMVRGTERESRVLFEVRRQILDLDESEVPVCCDQHAWVLATKLLSMFLPYCAFPAPTASHQPFSLQNFKTLTQGSFGIQAPGLLPTGSQFPGVTPNKYFLHAMMNQQIPFLLNQNSFGQYGNSSSLDMFKNFEKQTSVSSTMTPTPSGSTSTSSETTPDNKLPAEDSNVTKNKAVIETSSPAFCWPDSKTVDYEERRCMASKLIREKDVAGGNLRMPTSVWSGFGFSQSMPESVLKAKLAGDSLTNKNLFDFKSFELGPKPVQSSFWDSTSTKNILTKSNSSDSKLSPLVSYSNFADTTSLVRSLAESTSKLVEDVDNNTTVHSNDNIDLSVILTQLGLSKHLDVFRRHDIDFTTFITLNDADLQELGIAYFGRRKLLSTIGELKHMMTSRQYSKSSPNNSGKCSLNHFEAAPGAERSRKIQSKLF